MKKILIAMSIIFLMLFIFQDKEEIIIPNESIRFRIIPNSNNVTDVYMKEKVLESVESTILSKNTNADIKESRKTIISNIDTLNDSINSVFKQEHYNMGFEIKYGMNYFPKKEYKNKTYKEGYYESLVVEIGEAQGDNFWCVLFPPLCLLEAEESEEVEYDFILLDLIKQLF